MKINISLIPYFNDTQWWFYYKPYIFINGFILRICGVYINVREKDHFNKLLAILHTVVTQQVAKTK